MLKIILGLCNYSRIRQHPIQQIERSSEELYERKEFYREKKVEQGSYTRQEHGLVMAKVTFLYNMVGACQAGYLTFAYGVIPDGPPYDAFPRRAETVSQLSLNL